MHQTSIRGTGCLKLVSSSRYDAMHIGYSDTSGDIGTGVVQATPNLVP
jgi:hypothetical protein